MIKVVQAYEVARINKRTREQGAKEVESDGHGEVARSHELNLHCWLSTVYKGCPPNSNPSRVGHGGLRVCG
jgi:hypothetical protein